MVAPMPCGITNMPSEAPLDYIITMWPTSHSPRHTHLVTTIRVEVSYKLE